MFCEWKFQGVFMCVTDIVVPAAAPPALLVAANQLATTTGNRGQVMSRIIININISMCSCTESPLLFSRESIFIYTQIKRTQSELVLGVVHFQ